MKKLASLLLALVMLISCVPAMAEDIPSDTEGTTPETYTITINNAKEGHVYEAYQIFDGNLYDKDPTIDDGVLTNVDWGTGVDSAAVLAALTIDTSFVVGEGEEAKNIFAGCLTAQDVAYALQANPTLVEEFAAVVGKHLTNEKFASTFADGKYTIDVPKGYYLVKNTTVPSDDAHTRFIIEVVEDSTVNPKSSAPSSEKKVDDKNDSDATEDAVNWQDSADYDIGDAVPFQLKATIGSTYDDYKAYYLAFHDNQSEGLTFNKDSVKVYVNDSSDPIDSKFYKVVEPGTEAENKCTFEVVFWNLKLVPGVAANSVITVEYTATLNENAKIGSEGNPNEMYLEFSNNPNSEWKPEDKNGDGDIDDDEIPTDKPETGKTPEDKVIVFTYEVDINKVKEDGQTALPGAVFKLSKWDEASKKWVELVQATEEKETVEGEEATTDPTTFKWIGVDDGKYMLEETKAPAGYNLLNAPIYFTVTGTHDVKADDPKLTGLTVTVTDQNGATIEEKDLIAKLNASVEFGAISSSIVNKAGAQLPETGGMGTTILYVGGGILVLAAIVLLIVKRRANAE